MKKLFRLRTIFTAILLLSVVLLAIAQRKTDAVDKLFSPWDKADTPGCALAIIKDGRIIYKRGYGMANLEHSVPISPQTVFYVGSVSKQFVAMSIAMLANQGKLSLDDEIRKYIPELPDYGNPITIRNLIHHTSGLRDYLTLLNIAGTDFGTYHQDHVHELIARQKELNFKPGLEYLYSNSGYLLLAVIVERASGESFREFTEKNIFKPLGMKSSHFHDDYEEIIKNRAAGYMLSRGGKYRNFISTFDCVGSGGLFTSVEDLFLWDQNFYHCKVGGRYLIELMHTMGKLNSGENLNYAFGLRLGSYKGLKTVWHTGDLGGYSAAMFRFPEQKFSVICLSNLITLNPKKLSLQVADIYLAGQFKKEKAKLEVKPETKLEAKPKAKPAEKIKFIKLPTKKLKEKVGAYFQPETKEIVKLILNEGRLILRKSNRNFPLAALSDTEFQVLDVPVNMTIKFEKQIEGKPLLFHVYKYEEKSETYGSFKYQAPTPEQLREYEGDYYSEELRMTFKLALKDGKLYFVHENAPQPPLQPVFQDKFTVRGFTINFIRSDEKKISGFTLDAKRVRNLRFNKK